jgi:hypothetical protein
MRVNLALLLAAFTFGGRVHQVELFFPRIGSAE